MTVHKLGTSKQTYLRWKTASIDGIKVQGMGLTDLVGIQLSLQSRNEGKNEGDVKCRGESDTDRFGRKEIECVDESVGILWNNAAKLVWEGVERSAANQTER